ncbi:N-glycosylation protein eos1 [Tolypocladium paradoxum]|uniref:N-glycosylation protein eos1 n=1 Tax=Tolypocladium paradoxum TaxID=94208 RepID=A0A2S4L550_9HYPO|nr:N-glycosylation protein eos1 [Tolypocladium paradoxum]
MATTAGPHHRASSTAPARAPDNPPPPPPQHPAATSAAPIAAATTASSSPSPSPSPTPAPSSVHPSLLQPRVAVVLNVPPPWHPWLFALRLCSILPALWWGLPSALQLLLRLLPGPDRVLVVRPGRTPPTLCTDADLHHHGQDAVPYALTEGSLATIWCFACGYLSFFFTDCLMSRWLINYTPQATIVRLLTINAVNAYLTLTVLSFTGGFEDPRLMLPGWIGIATTLTVCYHITHQKINIRKETSTSVNVFSIASYLTMVTLLIHMHSYLADYPTMPIVGQGRLLWHEASNILTQIKGDMERSEL